MRIGCAGVFALLLSSCVPPPVCGDGKRDDGENDQTCCQDTGCVSGICDASGRCVQPWQIECETIGADACLSAQPFRCGARALDAPSYDCVACGCADGGACTDGACLSAAVRDRVREGPIEDDLDMEEYRALFTELASLSAMTMVELDTMLLVRAREDARRGVFVVGASTPAGEEIVAAALSAFAPFATSTEDPCTLDALDESSVMISVPVDRATLDTCFYPGMFGNCVPPSASDCVLLLSRLPDAIVVVDADAFLPEMDLALLRRAGRSSPDTLDAALQEAISSFRLGANAFGVQPAFEVEVRGEVRQVRAYTSPRDPNTTYIVMPRDGAKAYRMQAFSVVWDDAVARAFMIDNDIRTPDCSFEVGVDELVTMHCENNDGAAVDAVVDGTTFEIVEVSTTAA